MEKYPEKHSSQVDDESSAGGLVDLEAAVIKKSAAEQERRSLARNETKAVLVWRYTFLLILLATAVAVSLSVYLFARNNEQEQFESAFTAHADRLLDSFSGAVGRQLGAIDALSVSVSAHVAKMSDVEFPFVTIPSFESSGSITRVLAGGMFVMWMPLVQEEQRGQWEEFARLHQNDLIDSLAVEEELRLKQDAYFGLDPVEQMPPAESSGSPLDHPFHDRIWNFTTAGEPQEDDTGPYLPIWQTSPTLPQPGRLNQNLLGHPNASPALKETLRTKQATLGFLNSGERIENVLIRYLEAGQYRHEKESFSIGDALSPLSYPVLDMKNGALVGTLFSNFYWRLYLADVLPPNVHGLICVLENSRGQSVSYRIDGPTAVWLGSGDLHDPSYDKYELKADIVSFVTDRSNPVTRGYTTVDLNPDFVSYVLHVYPSHDTEDDYITSQPLIYAIAVASIFGFTCMMFAVYNYLVENRQAVIMDKAVKSNVVISGLFPEQVRDRLLNDAMPAEKEEEATSAWLAQEETSNSNRVAAFLERGSGHRESFSSDLKLGSRPIADRYENTTVMFADMVGFTQWSSTRSPEMVFTLLESVYGAFDAIALRRAIFKVETIGDCYMCVTGLPKPQDDHGIRMAKFARDCLAKMDSVTKELAPRLGPGTDTLAIRIGLNSGEVTAGVLRGEKSRFQLFGDTVNTAARMESNGSKGRIHLSQSTADELIKIGKSHWLTARQTRIAVKGKGELQTYFLSMGGPETTHTTTSSETHESTAPDSDLPASPQGSSNVMNTPIVEAAGEGSLNE